MTGVGRPLDGVTVIDMTQLIAGPSATMSLYQLGADVVKVERPSGDLARVIGGTVGRAPTFSAYNSGKRSLAVDLSTDPGRAALRRVIAGSDVLVQAFRPGVMERLGLDWETLSAENDRLIYVSLSAYHVHGVGGRRPGVDAVLQAETGLMAITGEPDGDPMKTGFQIIDAATGLAIGQATLAALLQRERTGVGSRVELSLFEVATYMQTPAFATASMRRSPIERPGNTAGMLGAPTDLFEASDGYIMIAAYFPEQWIALCETMGARHLLDDPRYRSNADRIAHKRELSEDLAPIFATRTRDEWAKRLISAGVICAPVLKHLEILDDPDRRSLGRFDRIGTEDDFYWVPGLPYTASTWTLRPLGETPGLGEHSREVLVETGYSDEEVDELETAGVLATHTADGW